MRISNRKIFIVTGVGLSVMMGAAIAPSASAVDESARRGGAMFDRYDTDGDGEIAVADLEARAAKRAAAMDRNNDGVITREEAREHRAAQHERRKARRFPDTNGDGVVDRVEFETAQRARFDRLDANSDGVLSADEMKSGKRQRRGGGDR